MKSFIKNLKFFTVMFVVLSIFMLTGLVWQQYRSQTEIWAVAGENKRALRAQYALAGGIYTRDEVALAESLNGQRQYAKDPILAQSALQLVGDYTHIMSNTIEAAYQAELLGTKRNPLRQIWLDMLGKGIHGDNLVLTVDSYLMKKAYESLQNVKGAAVLMNYKTGEVLAMVSTPTTTPENVISYKNIPDTALVNRGINGLYAPASTFKMITSAAFIHNSKFDPNMRINCSATPYIPYGAKESLTKDGHGSVNLASAFSSSCNIFFGEVGRMVGRDELLAEVSKWGWNQKFSLDRLKVSQSVLTIPENQEALLTWASIGQPVGPIISQITPLHLAMEAGAIANGGEMMQPHIILRKYDALGSKTEILKPNPLTVPLSPEEAVIAQELMEGAVKNGFVQALQIPGYIMGAKSGTAEVESQEFANGLISAYVKDERFPLCVGVIVENKGSGAGLPLRVAKNLIQAAMYGYPNGLDQSNFSVEAEK